MSHAVGQVVIVGRDAPLWLAACVLQSALGPSGLRVSAVELPSRLGAADVYSSLPALEALHARLRVDERRLLTATRGAFTLGQHFIDATGRAAPFFHAFGSTGARIDKLEFLPHWLKARRQGLPVPFEDFNLTAAAAKHGRMLLPDADIERQGFTDYGYHLPAIPYAVWLKQLAMRRGVQVHEARELAVLRKPDATDLAAVVLEGGRRVDGDFFIDATGDAAVLLAGGLGVGRESWRQTFCANRLIVGLAPPMSPLPAYSDVRAGETGWVSLHPSQVGTHVLHAYAHDTPDDLALEHATRLARVSLQAAQVRVRDPGRRLLAWERNCVAIGEAACVFDAIHGVDLQAVQLGLVHLLPLFPVSADYAVERREYNQNLQAAFERLRDFQSAHYLLNRYGGAFWERARLLPASAGLLHKTSLFRCRGDVAHYEDESFDIHDWQALFLGHGVLPDSWDPAVDRTTPELVNSELRRILGFIRQKVEAQRPHADHLRRHP